MFYKSNTFFYGIYFVLGLYLIFTSIKAQTQENKWICIEKHRTENQLFIKESNGIPFFLFLGHANSQNDDPHISTVQICALFTIRLYKRCVSPYLGTKCNFYPSCSEFGFQAYKKYGFFIGTYDPDYQLVIDPVLSYSTYIGGVDGQDTARGVAVDGTGCAYVAGDTTSTDIPCSPGAYDTTYNDSYSVYDLFVIKVNPTATAIEYATYLGGTG